ncbi:hypothetical protein [Azospirillum argentinense]|uniref:hypothetical protein n=1 Tax=Azospirillum argentinense TaxID=2970906 RepID=UPI0032DF5D87
MLRFALPVFGALAAILTLAGTPQTAAAENLACQTVNGKTVCSRGSGSLSCQTVNDRTTCVTGPGALTCETVNGHTACRRGPSQPDLKPMPMPPMPPQAAPMPDHPFGKTFPFEEEA